MLTVLHPTWSVGWRRRRPEQAFGLAAREPEVVDLMASGASNREIAERLFITETSSVHVSNIIRKLGVANRGGAASVAYRTGLVSE